MPTEREISPVDNIIHPSVNLAKWHEFLLDSTFTTIGSAARLFDLACWDPLLDFLAGTRQSNYWLDQQHHRK